LLCHGWMKIQKSNFFHKVVLKYVCDNMVQIYIHLSHLEPGHTLSFYFLKCHFNIICLCRGLPHDLFIPFRGKLDILMKLTTYLSQRLRMHPPPKFSNFYQSETINAPDKTETAQNGSMYSPVLGMIRGCSLRRR